MKDVNYDEGSSSSEDEDAEPVVAIEEEAVVDNEDINYNLGRIGNAHIKHMIEEDKIILDLDKANKDYYYEV